MHFALKINSTYCVVPTHKSQQGLVVPSGDLIVIEANASVFGALMLGWFQLPLSIVAYTGR